jgi:hypothetical protein
LYITSRRINILLLDLRKELIMTKEQNKIIPMTDDLMFKKVWGDPDGIQRTEYIASVLLGIQIEKLKGKVEVLETEKRLKSKKR